MNWTVIIILYVVALLCCAIGFKSFIWFLSIGYGYAVAGIALASIILGLVMDGLSPVLIVANIVMFAYGIRLGTFLLKREMGNKVYKEILKKKAGNEPPMFVKIICWIFVGALYVCQTSGLHFRYTNGTADDVVLYIGIVIMAIGALTEGFADKQKSAQKATRPDMVAMEGLFKIVRCPNYLGEILFWTGVFISGVTSFNCVAQWVVALIGYVCIVYIMVDGAKRMEKGHIERYGSKEEYQNYANKTPILIPLIPLYHLYKEK